MKNRFLTGILLLSLLSSCGPTDNLTSNTTTTKDTTTTNPTTTNTTTTSSTTTSVENKYKLEVIDEFDQIQDKDELIGFYEEGTIITVKRLRYTSYIELLFNGVVLEVDDYIGEYCYYYITIPNFDSKIEITQDGYVSKACYEGKHNIVEKLYFENDGDIPYYKLICSNCDDELIEYVYDFRIYLRNDNQYTSNIYFKNIIENENNLELHQYETYQLNINFSKEEYNTTISDDIEIEYDENNLIFLHQENNNNTCTVKYKIICLNETNNSFVNIKYNNKTYKLNLNIKEFDLTKLNNVQDINELSNVNEFKEILDSIKYFNYVDMNYNGFKSNTLNQQNQYKKCKYEFTKYMEYVFEPEKDYKQLIDSCYVPYVFDLINENKKADRYMEIFVHYNDKTNGFPDAVKMASFKMYYKVHEDQELINPIKEITYQAIPLTYEKESEYLKSMVTSNLNSKEALIFNNLNSMLLTYNTKDDDIETKVFSIDNINFALFKDETYLYELKVVY